MLLKVRAQEHFQSPSMALSLAVALDFAAPSEYSLSL